MRISNFAESGRLWLVLYADSQKEMVALVELKAWCSANKLPCTTSTNKYAGTYRLTLDMGEAKTMA
jgi:hypothetical protein